MQTLHEMIVSDSLAVRRAAGDALAGIANDQLESMRSRTLRGIGVNERQFAPYAASTAKKKGIYPRLQPVTLFESGDMLGSLVVQRESLKSYFVRLDREQERQKGRRHQFGFGPPTRAWFGATTRSINRGAEMMGADISNATRTDRRTIFKIKVTA